MQKVVVTRRSTPTCRSQHMTDLLDNLERYSALPPERRTALCAALPSLATASNIEFDRALQTLLDLVGKSPSDAATSPASFAPTGPAGAGKVPSDDPLWQHALAALRRAAARAKGPLSPPRQGAVLRQACRHIGELYLALGPAGAARWQLLALLAHAGRPEAIERLVELLVADPPATAHDCALACAPLFQKPPEDPGLVFPRLLDALERPVTAAVVLDLANYWTQKGLTATHPAAPRASALGALCGAVTQRLQLMVERPVEGEPADVLHRRVEDAVALLVSLCSALALIGDDAAAPRLHQVLQLPHRRLRTEAAAALARLGDESGYDALVAMAAQPVVRSLALMHLKALDATQRVPEQFRSPAARAEGDLAAWLARTEQFGLAPQATELVDTRRLAWPGLPDAVDCFLFRYQYALPQGQFSNVGITGPVTCALRADLADLPPVDIYAAYAGWQAEHPEIQESAADALTFDQQDRWDDVQCRLIAAGYDAPQLVKLGKFFGDEVFVATAVRGGQPGTVVADRQKLEWYPAGHTRRPLGAAEAYFIHKGRKLLRSFNPELDKPADAEPDGALE